MLIEKVGDFSKHPAQICMESQDRAFLKLPVNTWKKTYKLSQSMKTIDATFARFFAALTSTRFWKLIFVQLRNPPNGH